MADGNNELSNLLTQVYQSNTSVQDAVTGLRLQLNSTLRSASSSDTTSATTGSGGGTSAWDVVSPILSTIGRGIPLVSGLLSLFAGGDSQQTVEPLVKYSLPPSIQLNAGLFDRGRTIDTVDYFDNGAPRATNSAVTQTGSGSQVVVQVHAIDSQSFLDHSDEIADAVRTAILNSHPLADVIS